MYESLSHHPDQYYKTGLEKIHNQHLQTKKNKLTKELLNCEWSGYFKGQLKLQATAFFFLMVDCMGGNF